MVIEGEAMVAEEEDCECGGVIGTGDTSEQARETNEQNEQNEQNE